jgi:hypothetical protein
MSKIKDVNHRYVAYSVRVYNTIMEIREYMLSHDDKRELGFLSSELRDALKKPLWLILKALRAMEKSGEIESQYLYGRRWYRLKKEQPK